MTCRNRWRKAFWLPVWALVLTSQAHAHDPRPVVVTLTESLPEIYRVGLRVPATVDPGNQPRVNWPANCSPVLNEGTGTGRSVQCPGGLEGRRIGLSYPAFNPSLAAYFQLTNHDGATSAAIIPPTQDGWIVPERPGTGTVAWQYLVLGMEHILGGVDHLLFVLGLLVIAGTTRRILWTITGFTLAHSITLALSSLGVIDIPIVPVEAGIALSILYLAVEIGQPSHDTVTYRYPVIVSFVFGLLHGLGFASALGEVGLPPDKIVLSLLLFNAGVELGQIAFIGAVVIILALVRHLPVKALVWRSERLAMYVVGIPSAYWLIDRLSFLV